MASVKIADVSKAATLLKKLVDKADVNKDGALRTKDLDGVAPANPKIPYPQKQYDLRSALHGVQRLAMSRGSVALPDVKKAVDEVAANVKAADRDQDGFLSDAEYRSLKTGAAKRFVDFVGGHAKDKVSDFDFAPAKTTKPYFSWKGTPAQVCSSALEAFSSSSKNNYWPSWGSPAKGAARYVLGAAEAKEMVKALEPLYASRQSAVLTELAGRTAESKFGCVSCDAGARKVFEQLAAKLGVKGLTFNAVAAPKMPSP